MMTSNRVIRQCGEAIILMAPPDSGYVDTDEFGMFTLFCVKDLEHDGSHETAALRWPQSDGGLRLVK